MKHGAKSRGFVGALVVGVLTLSGSGGCSQQTLETGYAYNPLNTSPTRERRAGYFATPFSPEARAAQLERAAGFGDRRGE